jgi:hypothetical protein
MDQYMTPVQQQDMGGVQYPPQQMAYPQQQMQQGSMPIQQHQMMPAMMATPVTDEFAAPLAAAKTPAIPEWLRDALVVAAVAFVFGHPTTRATLSQWLPMLTGDRRDSMFGLVIFGLLVGGGSVAINRLVAKN